MSKWKLDDGRIIDLLTPEDLERLPDGTALVDVSGREAVKGRDKIDGDTRYGYLAYGILRPSVEAPEPACPTCRDPWPCPLHGGPPEPDPGETPTRAAEGREGWREAEAQRMCEWCDKGVAKVWSDLSGMFVHASNAGDFRPCAASYLFREAPTPTSAGALEALERLERAAMLWEQDAPAPRQSESAAIKRDAALVRGALLGQPQPDLMVEHESLKALIRQTFGYTDLWCLNGFWCLERPGTLGTREVWPLTGALAQFGSPPPERPAP